MNQVATINDGLRAGVAALRDGKTWKELAATAFRPATLFKALGIAVVLAAWNSLALLLFNGTVGLLVSALLAIWIWPPVLRWFIGTIARRAAWPLASAQRLEQHPRPPVADYRKWWMPVLAAEAAWRFAQRMGLDDSFWVTAIAVIMLQAWISAPAFARSLLVSWIPLPRIDESVAARRRQWALLAGGFLLAFALLQFVLTRLLGLTGVVLFANWLASSTRNSIFPLLLAKVALVLVIDFVAAMFLVAAAAAIAMRWISGAEAPVDRPADGMRSRSASTASVASQALVAARRLPYALGGALLLVFLLMFALRSNLAYWALGSHFRDTVAAQGNGDWSSPEIRQWTRDQLACEGDTTRLRILHWAGVGDSAGWMHGNALACAIAKNDLTTLGVLLDIGDEPDHEQRVSPSGVYPAVYMTPLAQAFTQPRWREIAGLLVEHGATLASRNDGQMDAVQGAASVHCLECLAWLKSRGASFSGTDPATPITLWLDNAGGDADRVAALKQLAAMGLSASAIGADRRNPLHAAARLGDPDAVAWLVAQGADPKIEDKRDNMPLDYAAFHMDCCNPGQPGTAQQHARLDTILALMPISVGYRLERAHPRTYLARAQEDPADPQPWKGPDLPLYHASTLNPHLWWFSDAAVRSSAIRARAHDLGWKIKYENPLGVVSALPPDEAEKAIADMPDEELGTLLSTSSDTTGTAIEHGWWPELVRAAPMWEDRLRFNGPDCALLARLVAGENDPSPQAATSWALVHAWFHAGARWKACKPGDKAAIEHAVARLPAARRADWDDMMRSQAVSGDPGL